MKVYQCIHKYGPHIPQFEQRHGIDDRTELTFKELRRLVIEDGYAASYVLLPAMEDPDGSVFYTIWNYERLQRLWAREHGWKAKDLAAIRRAQIEEFQPDVVYNMSAYYDRSFAVTLPRPRSTTKVVCWNAIIEERPTALQGYDCHFSLHAPYVKEWNSQGIRACELQPGIPRTWVESSRNAERPIDVLFYGQYTEAMFTARNRLVDELARIRDETELNVELAVQFGFRWRTYFKVPGLPRLTVRRLIFPDEWIRKRTSHPRYGSDLYRLITQSKIVVNACTDHNRDYKSNMRLFEGIGHGALLLAEAGAYPPGFEAGRDFVPYKSIESLRGLLQGVLSDWPQKRQVAESAQERIASIYSKENQWATFVRCIASL